MSSVDVPRVLALPAWGEQVVQQSSIDQNLHMNITEYFKVGVIAP